MQHAPEDAEQLGLAKRLRQEIVATRGERLGGVEVQHSGRQRDDPGPRPAGLRPQAPGHGEPIRIGQPEIEQDRVGVEPRRLRQGAGGVRRRAQLEAQGAQQFEQEGAVDGDVVDDEQPAAGAAVSGYP